MLLATSNCNTTICMYVCMFNAGSIPTMIAVSVFDCIGFATRSSGSLVKFVHYNMGGEPWFLYDDVLRDDPFPVLDVQVVLAEHILSYPGGSTVWLLKSTNLELFYYTHLLRHFCTRWQFVTAVWKRRQLPLQSRTTYVMSCRT